MALSLSRTFLPAACTLLAVSALGLCLPADAAHTCARRAARQPRPAPTTVAVAAPPATLVAVRNDTGFPISLRGGRDRVALPAGAVAHLRLLVSETLVLESAVAGLAPGTVLYQAGRGETVASVVVTPPLRPAGAVNRGLSGASLS